MMAVLQDIYRSRWGLTIIISIVYGVGNTQVTALNKCPPNQAPDDQQT